MRRALLATAALAVFAFGLTRGATPPPAARNALRSSVSEPAPVTLPPAPPLTRNPFAYSSGLRETVPGPRVLAPLIAPAVPAPPPAARLVGLVRQSGALRAVLMLHGEMALLAVGESAEGFTLLAADEESGVRLRGPDGELALALEP